MNLPTLTLSAAGVYEPVPGTIETFYRSHLAPDFRRAASAHGVKSVGQPAGWRNAAGHAVLSAGGGGASSSDPQPFPTVVYQVASERYEQIARAPGAELQLPLPGFGPTFYTQDPAGNSVGFTPGGPGGQAALLRVELDCRRIEETFRAYESVLGIVAVESGLFPASPRLPEDCPYAVFQLGGAQTVLLVERSDANSAFRGFFVFSVSEPAETLRQRINRRKFTVVDCADENCVSFLDDSNRQFHFVTGADGI
jgi:hypothetical protein